MALVAVDSAAGALVELDAGAFGDSPETLAHLLESQRDLFHSQIEQLQQLVVVQCKLTGVNPLAQEMAAGALSIKIGKRPRDLLNPKAVKYMQSVFSIKDTIGKKETREISALCGVTVSQVREYFSGQRSRVRKLVRLSREKATRSEASKLLHENCMPHLDNSLTDEATIAAAEHMLIVDNAQIPVQVSIPNIIGNLQLPVNIAILPIAENANIIDTTKNSQDDIATSSDLKKVEETHLSSLQEENVTGINFDDKKFIDDIFNLMGKEKTFSGQVKLMEWILRIQNTAVLNWFLTKGGLTILATWLSQSAVEEQTTMIHLILKVFCHLPLQKALPMQMSAILQAVNKLRFYRFSDISHRAKVLLSRWSKQLIRSQALKKPFNSSSRTARNKQRIGDVLIEQSWQSKEDILYLTGNGGNNRMSKPKQELKLLPAPGDDASKKNARVASSAKSKERRKVLLVEQPDNRSAGRTTQVVRIASLNHRRPISADDIQKAKMRAMFMQDKYGKIDAASSGNKLEKKNVHIVSASRIPEVQQVINEDEQQRVVITDTAPNETEITIDPKQSSSSTLQLDKLSCCKIQWKNPPAVRIRSEWCVAVGEKSKEVEVQTQRNKREKETLYSCPQDIPLNPKEPWDFEMDFDDSLTPEIPIEQPPEADVSEGPSCSNHDSGSAAAEDPPNATLAPPSTIVVPTSTQLPNSGASQPDMELLAVLLKNPELVLALTSNQGKTLTSDEMVALLDMLKSNGNLLAGLMNGSAHSTSDDSSQDVRQYEPEPTSLPSPTPPSDIARMAWRSQFPTSMAPVLQPFSGTGVVSTSIVSHPPVPSLPEVAQARAHSLALPHAPANMPSIPQSIVTNIPTLQSRSTLNIPTKRHPLPSAPRQITPSMYPIHQPVSSEPSLRTSHRPVSDPSLQTVLPRQDFFTHSTALQTSVLHSASLKSQTPVVLPEPPKAATWSATAASATSFLHRDTTPDQWISRSNRLVDVPASNQQIFSNQNNYNAHSHVPTLSPNSLSVHSAEARRRLTDGSTSITSIETWGPDNDPGRSRDSRDRWSHSVPSRRDNGWNDRPEWSRQSMRGDRGHRRTGGSGKRWRERRR